MADVALIDLQNEPEELSGASSNKHLALRHRRAEQLAEIAGHDHPLDRSPRCCDAPQFLDDKL